MKTLKSQNFRRYIMYEYNAHVDRVVDGDTLILNIDLGFDIWHKHRVRLSRINAPEVSTPEGVKSADFVRKLLEGTDVRITSKKRVDNDNYGRYLVEVYANITDDTNTPHEVDLNEFLVSNGLAKWYGK
jgi:endonuclease YncB( thermonuclease family)